MVKPQNISEIKKTSLNFWLLFLFLVFFSIIPAFFFTWASQSQHKAFVSKILEYRKMQNKQFQLQERVDVIYKQMQYVSTDKVDNYLLLEKNIIENKGQTAGVMGGDSTGNFAGYSRIVKNLNTSLSLRDSLVRITEKEETVIRELQECIDRNSNIRKNIMNAKPEN